MKTKKNNREISKKVARIFIAALFTTIYVGCGNHGQKENAMYERMISPQETNEMETNNESNQKFNTEEYNTMKENEFKDALQNPLSTFSIDVDKASYSNVRRFLSQNQMPTKDAVRIEEMINYFKYDYPQPMGEHPFSTQTELSQCPWNKDHKLLHIGIQGKSIDFENLKPSNLVFLIDVSGSMEDPNKLPLVKASLKMLIESLDKRDRIALVTYAGNAGLVLPSTSCSEIDLIEDAIDNLNAGGSTAGGEGIVLAYKIAKENLIKEGNNRVILATDGDFNVGVSSTSELISLMEEKRKDNIYLTICGFGTDNYKDGRMEQISGVGNGNYFYIDNIQEAKKVFVTEMRANLFTIAKDVKIQVEFNPANVKSYRLIGYEDRMLNKEDFNNDKKDAGELGASHTVTALYEIVPAGAESNTSGVDKLNYQEENKVKTSNPRSNELMVLKLRYKPINSEESKSIETVVLNEAIELDKTSDNFRFASSVAAFGMLLRQSQYIGDFTYDDDKTLAQNAKAKDDEGYRAECIKMIETASLLSTQGK